MKSLNKPLWHVCLLVSLLLAPDWLCAQGTAFTYQGQLNDSGGPANGSYDFTFQLFNAVTNGSELGPILTNSATAVSNGLFTVTLDFGAGFFTGPARWLQIGARTNGSSGAYAPLAPRQPLTPAPYAIFANTASNVSGTLATAQLTGTVGNGQLANSSITVNAGTGLGGGGAVALGGATTLTNAGVLSVTGNSDITVTTVSGAVTLGDTATNTDIPSTIVKRDGGGNFSAASITLDNNLNLPATTPTAGIIFSGNNTLLHTIGYGDLFAGVEAGNLTTSGSFNTGIGFQALTADTSGFGNTAVGDDALVADTSGVENTAMGSSALAKDTNGGYNVAIGETALFYNTSGSYNTAIGTSALFNNTTGDTSTAIGTSALEANTTGTANVATGFAALFENTSGNNNTANGYSALEFNTNGTDNTAIGAGAIGNNTSGSGNTASGENVLVSLLTGNDNTAMGFLAMPALTNGSDNIAIGQLASPSLASGSGNIAIGVNSGSAIVTGNNNIDIANPGFGDETGTIRIGTLGTHTKVVMNGIFGVTVGGGSPVQVNANGLLGTVTSSRRFKQNIQSMDDASDVLLALHPVTFQYKPELDPEATPQFGLIAEDVEKVDPALVVRDNKHQIYSVRYEAVNAMLLNEFLKQHRKVEQQNTEIQTLQQENDSLQKRLDALEQAVRPLLAKR